jgi:hypothetical protein
MGGDERRRMPRVSVLLEGEWEDGSSQRVRVGDISEGGCYIETLAIPAVGARPKVRLTLPGGAVLDVRGEVSYAVPGYGFGLKFLGLTDEQKELLRGVMQQLLNPIRESSLPSELE